MRSWRFDTAKVALSGSPKKVPLMPPVALVTIGKMSPKVERWRFTLRNALARLTVAPSPTTSWSDGARSFRSTRNVSPARDDAADPPAVIRTPPTPGAPKSRNPEVPAASALTRPVPVRVPPAEVAVAPEKLPVTKTVPEEAVNWPW